MRDTFIIPSNKEEVVKYLNLVLKSHPAYESWMLFDDFEFKQGIKIPRYRKPNDNQDTKLTFEEYMEIYTSVATQVLGP